MKNSVNHKSNTNLNMNPMETIPEVTERLINIMKNEKSMKCHLQHIQYDKSLTLSRLKTLTITTKSFKKSAEFCELSTCL